MKKTLLLITVLLAGFCASATAQPDAPDLSSATDTDHYSDYSYTTTGEYCREQVMLGDLLKDVGDTLQVEAVALSAGVLSIEEELAIGERIFELVKAEVGEERVDSDPELTTYLGKMLRDLLPYATREGLAWQVHVIDSPVFNAFATPGGYIYVFTGMIDHMTNEAQLASVLAHEIGHIELRHTVSVIQYLKILGVWSEDDAESIDEHTGLKILTGAFRPFQSRFEEAADMFSAEVLFNAGYSPHQAAQFMTTVDFFYGGERPALGESFASFLLMETENLLSTHPQMRSRACRLMKEIELRAPSGEQNPMTYVGARNFVERMPRSTKMY